MFFVNFRGLFLLPGFGGLFSSASESSDDERSSPRDETSRLFGDVSRDLPKEAFFDADVVVWSKLIDSLARLSGTEIIFCEILTLLELETSVEFESCFATSLDGSLGLNEAKICVDIDKIGRRFFFSL